MPSIFKMVVNIAIWVMFIKGFINVVLSLGAGFTGMLPMPIVEAMGGIGIVALFLACLGAWLRKKLE